MIVLGSVLKESYKKFIKKKKCIKEYIRNQILGALL